MSGTYCIQKYVEKKWLHYLQRTWLELGIYTIYSINSYAQFIFRNYNITIKWNPKGLMWFTSIKAIKVKSENM